MSLRQRKERFLSILYYQNFSRISQTYARKNCDWLRNPFKPSVSRRSKFRGRIEMHNDGNLKLKHEVPVVEYKNEYSKAAKKNSWEAVLIIGKRRGVLRILCMELSQNYVRNKIIYTHNSQKSIYWREVKNKITDAISKKKDYLLYYDWLRLRCWHLNMRLWPFWTDKT